MAHLGPRCLPARKRWRKSMRRLRTINVPPTTPTKNISASSEDSSSSSCPNAMVTTSSLPMSPSKTPVRITLLCSAMQNICYRNKRWKNSNNTFFYSWTTKSTSTRSKSRILKIKISSTSGWGKSLIYNMLWRHLPYISMGSLTLPLKLSTKKIRQPYWRSISLKEPFRRLTILNKILNGNFRMPRNSRRWRRIDTQLSKRR